MNETQKLAKRSPLWGMMALLSMLVPSLPSSAQLMLPGAPQNHLTHQNASNTSELPKLNPADQQRFDQLMAEVKRDRPTPQTWSESLESFALKLLGQPYQAGLLDQSPTEELFLSLTQFDCVLFVESVLALAHSAATTTMPQPSSTHFAWQIQNLRYRDGIQDGYCSRLHYFSEWLDNNQARGYVQNLSQTLGGIPLNKRLQFMSRHRQSYPQLTNNETYDCIVAMEDSLASLPMHYIPTSDINWVESQLQPGDIIAVATAVPYLDVTHTGLMYQAQNGQMGLIHASPGGSVRLAPNLAEYVSRVESAIGVMVARPLEPKVSTTLKFTDQGQVFVKP